MTKKQNTFVIIAALVALLSFAAGGYFTFRKGITLGDDFLYKKSTDLYQKNASEFIERTSDDTFRIVADGTEMEVTYTGAANDISFTFPDGDVIEGAWLGDSILDMDQEDWAKTNVENISYTDITSENGPKFSDWDYSYAMCQIIFENEQPLSVWYFNVLGLLFYVQGMLMIMFPEKMLLLFRRWQFNRVELSDKYVMSESIGGVIFMIFGWFWLSGLFMVWVM